jgi:heat shock protein HslJ
MYLIAAVVIGAMAVAACAGSANTSAALDDTSWALVEVNGQPPAAPATLAFNAADQTAGGSNGCNSYSGSYSLAGGSLQFGELVQTLIGCEEAIAQQESTFMTVLTNLTGYTLEGSRLTLRAGEETLVFERVLA